jgi:hypothetical protein
MVLRAQHDLIEAEDVLGGSLEGYDRPSGDAQEEEKVPPPLPFWIHVVVWFCVLIYYACDK